MILGYTNFCQVLSSAVAKLKFKRNEYSKTIFDTNAGISNRFM